MNHHNWLKRAWHGILDMRMERKLLYIFIVVITIPLGFIGYISYSNYSSSIEETTIAYSTNLLENMMQRVDDYIEDMTRISSIPAYQDDIKQNLIRSNRYHEQQKRLEQHTDQTVPADFNQLLSIQRGIQSDIKFINNVKRGANSVYIFDKYGSGCFSAEAGGIRLNIEESYKYWMERADESGGEALLFGTQKYTSSLKSTRYAFTVVRKIMDQTLQPIGLIAVDANIHVIEDQITRLDKLTMGSSVIIDESGNVIYDSGRGRLALPIANDPIVRSAAGSRGSFYQEVNGERQLHIYTTSPNTNWKVIISIPVHELMRDSIVTRNVTWAATFLTIGAALILSIVFSFTLTKPLRKMMRLMRTVQQGDFNVKFPVRNRDEIGQLGSQFNRMITRIDELIQDIYQMEAKKKEAELHALQTQINPHFMYNTLEAIRMVAELNDDDKAADMLAVFGKLLRYSVGNLSQHTTLEREIQHVKDYVSLLNYRYPGRFCLDISLPPQLADYPMIRLMLQPIVENAVYHGLDDRKRQMVIGVKAWLDERYLTVQIHDDGVGVHADKLARLNLSFRQVVQSDQEHGGIGLKNINERIKLHYGSGYGLQASAREGGGTVVTMLFPTEISRSPVAGTKDHTAGGGVGQ
ncbi:cache domain-containing sensor histidine kinase [Paenibacillus tarimensis]|uniref:cache domain-containing sensor histidine kinase n=1 Tax=Paenibacillus tarimensis TaxID=416012 RepID=UPI001F404CC1|nr:sensor histidine kinase [Paenibacillus tarimensis]MCF2943682.1 sensor histidine kinase [Paenibacillus tarimensis]